jgi:hypothetical protein
MLTLRTADVDARAAARDTHTPARITIVQRSDSGFSAMLRSAFKADPTPAVLIGRDGRILQLTAGGSGIVWVETSGRFTEWQREMVQEVTAAFEAAYPTLVKPRRSDPETTRAEAARRIATTQPAVTPTREALDRIVGISEEAGMYEATTPKPRKKRAAKKTPPTPFTFGS